MPKQTERVDNRNHGYGATRREVEGRSTLDAKTIVGSKAVSEALSETGNEKVDMIVIATKFGFGPVEQVSQSVSGSDRLLDTRKPADRRSTDLIQN